MKKNVRMLFGVVILSTSTLVFARGFSHTSSGIHYPRSHASYGTLHTGGGTHNVRFHIKKDGTFVNQHRAANPRSGVHCKNNVCY